MTLPGVARPDKAGTRDYVKAYNYAGAPQRQRRSSNFTELRRTANGDGYPDNPDAPATS